MKQTNRIGSNDVVDVLDVHGKRLLSGVIVERGTLMTVITRLAAADSKPFWAFDTVELSSTSFIFQRVAGQSGENGLLHHLLTLNIEAEKETLEPRVAFDISHRLIVADPERFYALWARYPDGEGDPKMTRHHKMREHLWVGIDRLLMDPAVSAETLGVAVTKSPFGWGERIRESLSNAGPKLPRYDLIRTMLESLPSVGVAPSHFDVFHAPD